MESAGWRSPARRTRRFLVKTIPVQTAGRAKICPKQSLLPDGTRERSAPISSKSGLEQTGIALYIIEETPPVKPWKLAVLARKAAIRPEKAKKHLHGQFWLPMIQTLRALQARRPLRRADPEWRKLHRGAIFRRNDRPGKWILYMRYKIHVQYLQ